MMSELYTLPSLQSNNTQYVSKPLRICTLACISNVVASVVSSIQYYAIQGTIFCQYPQPAGIVRYTKKHERIH